MQFQQVEHLIIDWANKRNLIIDNDVALPPEGQLGKLIEEQTELSEALVSGTYQEAFDAIGDTMVVMKIVLERIAESGGEYMTLEDCLKMAYNTIKDRKGKTVNGVFVKE